MAHDPYAPKRNPADSIVDLHRPSFFPRKPQPPARPTFTEMAEAQYVPAPTVEFAAEQPAVTPNPNPEPADPTDQQWVAINVDKLRHLDLKAMVAEMFPEMPKDHAEIADKMAEWAAANNPRAAA